MRVAIQGELGSFSHEAAKSMLAGAMIVPCTTAADVFRAVLVAHADVAVIPIENSLAGSVVEFYDLLFEHDVCIVQEKLLRIRHNLIVQPGTSLQKITHVLSHPVALAQCRRFLENHPQIEPVAHYDTAGSVQTILQSSTASQAAIASTQAAEQYGGQILLAGIEDSPENFTRFLLLQRRQGGKAAEPVPEPPNKMSLVFFLENRPGALVQALDVFSSLHLNLTKIESRPVRGRPWEYMFCADVQLPHPETADIALSHLQRLCPVVKELGRYHSVAS
ncbi:MAG TPA: prephenate dehydratase [Acidobacteriaceae bacterium]|jgi:prephenate dehydratase|nr:prephenate dehydratase [Acidobacteriaceae bacterium]